MKKKVAKKPASVISARAVTAKTATRFKANLESPKDNFLLEGQTNDMCCICGFSVNNTKFDVHGQMVFHKCYAPICLKCLQHAMDQQYANNISDVFCPICLKVFDAGERAKLHPDLNNTIAEKMTIEQLSDLIECRFCSNRFTFEPISASEVKSSYEGRELTPEQMECAAKNYLLCNECRVSSCFACGAVPYHVGETCEEHKWYVEGYICRICGRAACEHNIDKIPHLTCGHPHCVSTASEMCSHVHNCGHACVGIKDETVHPVCPECNAGGSKCPHCDRELWGNVCLSLECGHTIHRSCAAEIIKRRRTGPELILPLCPTPGCGEFVKHKSFESSGDPDYKEWLSLEKQVNEAAKQRVIAEGIEYHPEVASKSSLFSKYEDKAALYWAKKRLRFMICNKHGPFVYTLGRVDDPPVDTSTSCPECPTFRFPKCSVHGATWMQYKCESCCSVGVRLTFNKKHSAGGALCWYCEICHDMPGRAQSITQTCKGNCKFAPHQSARRDYFGKCAMCGQMKSRMKPSSRD